MDIYLLERSEIVVMEKKGSREDNIDTKQKISKHIKSPMKHFILSIHV